jgi:hypothetical protein
MRENRPTARSFACLPSSERSLLTGGAFCYVPCAAGRDRIGERLCRPHDEVGLVGRQAWLVTAQEQDPLCARTLTIRWSLLSRRLPLHARRVLLRCRTGQYPTRLRIRTVRSRLRRPPVLHRQPVKEPDRCHPREEWMKTVRTPSTDAQVKIDFRGA